jgi:predicted protein tyrosine phosphatase
MGNSSCKKSFSELNDEEWYKQMERDRNEGRALLKKIVLKSDDVDWESIIVQAEFFYQREKKQLKKRVRKWRRKQTLQALDRRRRYEAAGSFSVNLLTIAASDDVEPSGVKNWRDAYNMGSHSLTCSSGSSDDQRYENETSYNTELLLDSRTSWAHKSVTL